MIPDGIVRRLVLIATGILALALVVMLLRPSWTDPGFRMVSIVRSPDAGRPIPAEAGAFRDLRDGLLNVGEAEPSPHVVMLTRAERNIRREYDGAPPTIPHDLSPELARRQDCAPCHTFGGYNPVLRTYAPRTPHPEMSNCLQCHVRPVVLDEFVPSDWVKPEVPRYGEGGAVIGAPPVIPHGLQMREHCVSCHGGPSSAPDIRTDHPERFNCRQCHAAAEAPGAVFSRPVIVGSGS
jgi:nitrate reductase (cytochrome), electron transfer subunit